MERLTRLLFAAACTCAYAVAVQGEQANHNPPRNQQEIDKERMAACKALYGQDLKDCIENYVGKSDKSRRLDAHGATAPLATPQAHFGKQSNQHNGMPHESKLE